jgi:hypothetical protein
MKFFLQMIFYFHFRGINHAKKTCCQKVSKFQMLCLICVLKDMSMFLHNSNLELKEGIQVTKNLREKNLKLNLDYSTKMNPKILMQ